MKNKISSEKNAPAKSNIQRSAHEKDQQKAQDRSKQFGKKRDKRSEKHGSEEE